MSKKIAKKGKITPSRSKSKLQSAPKPAKRQAKPTKPPALYEITHSISGRIKLAEEMKTTNKEDGFLRSELRHLFIERGLAEDFDLIAQEVTLIVHRRLQAIVLREERKLNNVLKGGRK